MCESGTANSSPGTCAAICHTRSARSENLLRHSTPWHGTPDASGQAACSALLCSRTPRLHPDELTPLCRSVPPKHNASLDIIYFVNEVYVPPCFPSFFLKVWFPGVFFSSGSANKSLLLRRRLTFLTHIRQRLQQTQLQPHHPLTENDAPSAGSRLLRARMLTSRLCLPHVDAGGCPGLRLLSPCTRVGLPPHGDCGAGGQPGGVGLPALVLQWIKSRSYLSSGGGAGCQAQCRHRACSAVCVCRLSQSVPCLG